MTTPLSGGSVAARGRANLIPSFQAYSDEGYRRKQSSGGRRRQAICMQAARQLLEA
jgi:hypothetical protein